MLEIPLSRVDNPAFYVVNMMHSHFLRLQAPQNEPLFYLKKNGKWVLLLYKDLLQFIKDIVGLIGLDPADVGLHSMRRSATSYLHHLNVPLQDIKYLGDWKSMAVLLYLITPLERNKFIELMVSSSLAHTGT